MKHYSALVILSLLFMSSAVSNAQPLYYTTGTKWTELQLDTLLYDSWYEKIEAEGKVSYKPNFEVVEYYVGEKYQGNLDTHGFLLHGIYVHKEGKQDSLVCYLAQDTRYNYADVSLTAIIKAEPELYVAYPTSIYHFPMSPNIGDPVKFLSLSYAQMTGGYFGPPFAYVKEVGYDSFGSSHQHKYVLLDNGMCIVDNIGVTSWNGKECIIGPADIYWCVADFTNDPDIKGNHHHCSMLVRFEKDGELLYNMWPNEKGELVQGMSDIAAQKKGTGIFDLQGRRLAEKPQKGLFIKDGKVMAK